MSDSVRPHRLQPTRLPRPWDSPGKNTGVGCHFLLQCMKVKSESESEVISDSSRPHGLQPTRLLHPWDFPGKSTAVGCHYLLRPVSQLWKKWFNSSGWRPGSIRWRFPRQLQISNSSVCRMLNMTLCWLEYLQVQIPSGPRKSVPFCSKRNLDKVSFLKLKQQN